MLVGPVNSDVDLRLYRPDGSLVSSSDPGVSFTKSANSVQASIIDADPGVWQYQIVANELDPAGENVEVWANAATVPTTILTQDSETTQYPQSVTFNAHVMSPIAGAATPTGNVQFEVNGSPAGSPVALDDAGQASWTTTGLPGGSHSVTVDYLGSAAFIAPSSAPVTHVVTKADQAITFGALASKTYGDADFTVSASASSGLTAAFGAAGMCTVSGTTIHIVGAGSCTITASQAGDGNYNAAADVQQSFDIAKADQTITFGALVGRTYGDPDFAIIVTASSGLTVTFAAAGDCTVSGTTAHITAAGSCTITASQPGDANYNPASDVAQSFSIAKKALTITAKAATKSYGQTLTFAGTEFSVAGLVAGDGVTSVTLVAAGQSVGAQPGSYDIVPSAAIGNRLSNYVIGYVNGTLTVNLVAIVGLDGVSVNGSGLVDSYNGAVGPYKGAAPNGAAFIVSNGLITVNGSAAIHGDIRSTQGSVSPTKSTVVTGNVFAGTTIPTTSPIRGLASPNSPVPALIAPAVAACSPYSSGAGVSGSYTYNAATGDLTVSGSKTATIAAGTYCFGSITISGSAKLVVSGPVTIKLTGKFSLSGSALINQTGNAASLQISTSYAGSNGVVMSGSGIAHLTVYAPAAEVVISGSSEIDGLILGKSVTVSGSVSIHQDTSATSVWAGYFQK
jgi:cytoskeletal protein CcmA (bactofilin family)